MERDKPKRIRRDPDTARRMILDMTEKLMLAESHAAVSSRRIAQELGLTAATIHYYYPTTDDLFIALHRRMMDRHLVALEAVLASDEPLRALWTFQSQWSHSALGVELLALATHRKAVGAVLAGATNAARDAQARIVERVLARSGVDSAILPPVALATISIAIARTLANEERVGITRGHEEVRRFVDWLLDGPLRPRD